MKNIVLPTIIFLFCFATLLNAQSVNEPDWAQYYEEYRGHTTAMVLDHEQNVFVAGYIYESKPNEPSQKDAVLLKYSNSGELLWRRILTNFGSFNYPDQMKVDVLGNIYLSLNVDRSNNSSYNEICIKYDSYGNYVWTSSDTLFRMAIESYNSTGIVITGYSIEEGLRIKAFNGAGEEEWSSKLIVDDWFEPQFVSVNAKNNVYILGSMMMGATPPNFVYVIIKFDSSGNQQWDRIVSAWLLAELGAEPKAILFDKDENLYVVGYVSFMPSPKLDVLLKYDSQGNEQWIYLVENGASDALAFDENGNLVVFGNDRILKYDTDGNEIFRKALDEDFYSEMQVDKDGAIFLAGSQREVVNNQSRGAFQIKMMDTAGNHLWDTTFSKNDSAWNQLAAFTIDSSGNMYAALSSQNNNESFITTLKYSRPFPVKVESPSDIMPDELRLHQNYPNPFNPVTTIGYELPIHGEVEVVIYNILGQKVKTLVNEFQTAGFHKMEFNGVELPSGVYIYEMKTGNFSERKKLLLLK